jgi:hypothetical protein
MLNRLHRQFPSLEELAKNNIRVGNETQSSAHTNTKHAVASYTGMNIPTTSLSPKFWKHRTEFEFPTLGVDSEYGVTTSTFNLLRAIIKALELGQYFSMMHDVPIMDTAPDLTIVTAYNKLIAGTVEVKKPPKTDCEEEKMFGSGTPVAGEVFEQLMLSCIQKSSTESVGLVSTLGCFQLVALKDVGARQLSAADTLKYVQQKSGENTADPTKVPTPDKPKVVADVEMDNVPIPTKKTKVEMVQRRGKSAETKTKHGAVARVVEDNKVKREYFATKPVKFGSKEQENREVMELLAAFVLLCVETARAIPEDKPLDLTAEDSRCLTREVKENSFAFKDVVLPSGLQFHSKPSKRDSTFYVARQLGYGDSGASCFGFTSKCAPCVLKFYRHEQGEDLFANAKEEAKKWETLYADDVHGIDFVQAIDAPRAVLVMPYLKVPCNYEERRQFVEGDKESLLYLALKHVSSKGYVHHEPRWHHVGLWNVMGNQSPENEQSLSNLSPQLRKRNAANAEASGKQFAVFCDLAHVTELENEQDREKWVNDTFEYMQARIGDEQDVKRQIKG